MSKANDFLKLVSEAEGKKGAKILFLNANEVFLVKEKGSKNWIIPGGVSAKTDGDLHDTAIRSFRECMNGELPGYASTGKSHESYDEDYNCDVTTFLFQPQDKFQPKSLKEPLEEAQWFKLDSLPKNIHPSTKKALEHFNLQMLEKPRGWK